MDVVSVCALRASSLVWQPRFGTWAMTVVCKATYRLLPGTSALAESQEYPSEEENHWNDDPARSVYAPSDLAPFKPSPELLLVGQAFSPRGELVSRLLVRVIVGDVDKSIEVCADEALTQDGSLREGPRFARMPLRWERAAGGPETSNPVGIRLDAPNALGVVQIPNLRTPGTMVGSRRDFIEPVCFGPIGSTWPSRRQALARIPASWTEASLDRDPIPEGLDPRYFMVAPRDQALSALRSDERIVLDNLHPEHPRLATNLPGVEPRVFVDMPRRAPWELKLTCDTLWIDTEQSICTLTWRGQFQLESPSQAGRVVVAMQKAGRPLSWAEVERMSPPAENEPTPDGPETRPAMPKPATMPFVAGVSAMAEPPPRIIPAPSAAARAFAEQASPTAPMKSGGAAAMGPAWLSRAPSPSQPDLGPPPPVVPPPPVPMPSLSTPGPVVPPLIPAPPAATPPVVAPLAVAASPWATPVAAPAAPAVPSPPAGSWLKGAAASSNAAAAAAAADPPPVAPRAAEPKPAPEPRAAPQTGRENVDLIWFEPNDVPRVRAITPEPAKGNPKSWLKGDGGSRPEPQEAQDRRDVLRVISTGDPLDEAGVGAAISTALRSEAGFEPPVVLVSGELSVAFDEIETLRATLSVATPFLGVDKKLRDVATAATEALKSEWPMPGDIADGHTARIEEAFAQSVRAVASGYLQSTVERMLLEGRRYQKRTLFGERRIRVQIGLAGASGPTPAYLPEAVGPKLPLFRRFRARAAVEVRPQEDQYESHGDALVILALARVVRDRRG